MEDQRTTVAANVIRAARYRPAEACRMGIEICRDGVRMYETVRWKADLAGALIERWTPRWFHFVEPPVEAADMDAGQERHLARAVESAVGPAVGADALLTSIAALLLWFDDPRSSRRVDNWVSGHGRYIGTIWSGRGLSYLKGSAGSPMVLGRGRRGWVFGMVSGSCCLRRGFPMFG